MRLILGLLKGAVIGGLVGLGAHELGLIGSFNWLTCALVGVLVGLICGRPVWSHLRDSSSTFWTSVLKAVFGAGVAVGLYALASRVWGGVEVSLLGETRNVLDFPFVLGGALGALYGAFVEVDDPPRKAAPDEAPRRPARRPPSS